METSKSNNVINLMLQEGENYLSIENIIKLVQEGGTLTGVPLQPVYFLLKSLTPENASVFLEALDDEQKQALLDLDLWNRDNIDPETFLFWIKAYESSANEKLKIEFVKSTEFALFIKGKFNIQTFDLEDPDYPDHDNFFLTEDNLLLFEYDESFDHVEEVQNLLRILYAELGVENAYALLFKSVADSFLIFQEDEFSKKKSRLEDYGFVDYYDALEIDSAFPSFAHIDNFIKKKKGSTGKVDSKGLCQSLYYPLLVPFKNGLNDLKDHLSKIDDQKRSEFLHFNFTRLMNSVISKNDGLKEGSIGISKLGSSTKDILSLGFDYILNFENINTDHQLFMDFDFIDVFKIGNSLIKNIQKKLKKGLKEVFEKSEEWTFCGEYWDRFFEESFLSPPRCQESEKSESYDLVNNKALFNIWCSRVDLILNLLPFISNFKAIYQKLEKSGTLQNNYYLNYSVLEIDFEAIFISCFANFVLGHFSDGSENKLGITTKEYLKFVEQLTFESDELIINDQFLELSNNFFKSFGMERVENLDLFFSKIMKENLDGYNFNSLAEADFKHVGGPIILNLLVPIPSP